ncbi:zinc finger autosomal protein-like [Anoplophora glabripennis]|uniref:zinc finger autosomal protein-like n=1 Tax=Anoplophora glabripennis TaxID=217634 RepID=UPI000C778B2F|nr:zinc finger autosomal protein-like [Anoplophora glabripennis]
MSDVKETPCRLCLKNISDKSFEVIDSIIRNILDVLLLKLKFEVESKEVICDACRTKLNAASEFKSACLSTNNTIIPYVDNEKMLQLDLREVYMQEKRSELVDISCSQKLCRLCMRPVENEFRCISEEELEAIEKLAPEIIINIVKDPIVCNPCFDSLCTHNSFLEDCLEVEEKIKGSQATESQTEALPSYVFVKTENLDNGFDINEMEMSIKAECVDIKSEDEERSYTPLLSYSKSEEEDECKQENGSANECNAKAKHQVKYEQLYKYNFCDFKTKQVTSFNSLYMKRKDSNKCDERDKTIYNSLTHKDASQLPIYKCKVCNYKSKKKILLMNHQLVHKDPSQVKMYRCNECDYETKYKYVIANHQLKHKDTSQVQMYRCNDCDYVTKYSRHMKQHQLKHKDPSQIQMYRCNHCDYESIYSSYFKKHQLKHRDPSQVQTYKCNHCDYETIYKSYIKKHQLKHKDPSQVEMYGCNDCNYETKYKNTLKKHQLKHKDPSQVEMYRCNDCDYKTKHRENMKLHELKHKDPSQIKMYKCNECDFETKYKNYVKRHELKHKVRS